MRKPFLAAALAAALFTPTSIFADEPTPSGPQQAVCPGEIRTAMVVAGNVGDPKKRGALFKTIFLAESHRQMGHFDICVDLAKNVVKESAR